MGRHKKGGKPRKKIDRTKPVTEQWHQYNEARASRYSEPTLTTPPVTRRSALLFDPENILDIVDDILDAPTAFDERIQRNVVGTSAASSKAAAKMPEPGSSDDESDGSQSRSPSPRYDNRKKNPSPSSRERDARYRDDRSRSPSRERGQDDRDRKQSSSRPAGGQKNDQSAIDLISNDGSDRERERRGRRHGRDGRDRGERSLSPDNRRSSKDMRDTKEERRATEDPAHALEAARHAKQVSNTRQQIADLKAQVTDGENQYDELQTEFEVLKRKHGLLENENAYMKQALTHIRNNPEQLISQIAQKGSGSRKKGGKRKSDGQQFLDDRETEAGMIKIGKEAVNAVYRTVKFINNDGQLKLFTEQVMNNLGKEELIVDPNMTEEQKAVVKEKRTETCEVYGGVWVTQLNDHGTYVQVSTKQL